MEGGPDESHRRSMVEASQAAERARLLAAVENAQRALFELASETARRAAAADDAEADAAVMEQYLANIQHKVGRMGSARSGETTISQAAASALAALLAPPE